jgi:hypothetical protein
MKTRTNVKAGKIVVNHNPSLTRKARGVQVRTSVKAGRVMGNHNRSLLTHSA